MTIPRDTHLLNLFESNRAILEQASAGTINKTREDAVHAFSKLGIPTNKTEMYKYTNLTPWFNAGYSYNPLENGFTGNIDDIVAREFDFLVSHTVFLVNGRVIEGGYNDKLPAGVEIGSFASLSVKNKSLLEKYYGKLASFENDGLVALNSMLALDGILVIVPDNVIIEKPVQVVNILTGNSDRLVNQRNMVIVGNNSRARVVFCDQALSGNRFLVNSVTETHVGQMAELDFYNIQNQHNGVVQVGGYYFNQHENSLLNANFFTLNTGVTRNNIFARLAGTLAECHVSGLYLTDKNMHVDNFSFIDHAVPDCQSHELFKGVMDDGSTGAFTGRIMVRPDAQRTNAYQSNNNLLLTDYAKMYSRPQLEIYADDVKCSHGATVGQVDENALFYLRARGIGKEEATILLMYAFAYEVIEKIKLPELKEQIRVMVEKRFRGELDKCDSCILCGQNNENVLKAPVTV